MTPQRFGRLAGLGCLFTLLVASPAAAQAPAVRPDSQPPMTAVLYVESLTPPPIYKVWYEDMERCTGLQGNYYEVQWYTTPAPWSDGMHGGLKTYGAWRPPHRILLNRPEMNDSGLVTHEIIHDLLADNGLGDPDRPHPAPYFGDGPTACAYELHP